MHGKTYIIVSAKAAGDITLKYDLNGYLIEMQITANLTPEQFEKLFSRAIYLESTAESLAANPNSSVKVLPEDLSFERFYDAYNNKLGKKVMAEKSWKALSRKDKIDALVGIKAYDFYLSRNPGISKAYPTTYINQRYWEGYKQ
ncbi:MAG: hypothetical protein U0T77_10650 [Chitinophagales bacterium]